MNEEVIKIGDIVEALKKRLSIIIAITVGCTLISALVSFFVLKPKYEASTKVFIGKDTVKGQDVNSNDVQMYQKLMKTYAQIIKTNDLVEEALKKANLDMSIDAALESITVVPAADTQIMEIKVVNGDPVVAKDLTDAVTEQFMVSAKEYYPNGDVKIMERVQLPEKPVSPNKKMNIAIAFLLGAMLGVGLALFLEFLDNTYKTKESLERDLELPVLGIIPLEDEV